MNNYGGSYPWSLNGDSQSVVHLVNSGIEEAAFVIRIDTSGGAFIPSAITLDPGQAIALDIREIRDSQVADPAGRTIPLSATEGRFFWREFGSTGLVGRLEPYNPTVAMAASYSCPPDCCMSSTEDLQVAPATISGDVGTQQQIRLWADVQYGCDPFPMLCDVTRRGHFSTDDETIATATKQNGVALVTFVAVGDTEVLAWVRAQECSGPPPCPGCPGSPLNPGCSCLPNLRVDAPPVPAASEPVLTGFAPDKFVSGDSGYSLTIYGEGFTPSTTVHVDPQSGVTISNVEFFEDTQLQADISVPATAPHGPVNVTVKVGGKSSNAKAILIQRPTYLLLVDDSHLNQFVYPSCGNPVNVNGAPIKDSNGTPIVNVHCSIESRRYRLVDLDGQLIERAYQISEHIERTSGACPGCPDKPVEIVNLPIGVPS